MNYLSSMGDMIKATEFIGQSSGKTLKGQTQKEQQAVLEKFRSGGYNVIVATSIGEEGLDIMEVDLVICFDANVSPLRMIQRMGRTGRKNDGRVVILACEGSELKSYVKKQGSSKAMRKHMNNGGIKNFNFHPSPRMIPHMCKPQVQYLEMSIEQFIPRGKKAKNSAMERSPFSRNISNEELNLISKYFPRSVDAVWKPSLIAFPSFQTFPSRVSKVRHSFKTTSMFINAMQDLQGLSSSEVNDNGFIEVEKCNQPLNELRASGDNIRRAGEALEVKVSSPKPHHDAQKPKPHRLLFGEGSVTVNSSGTVFIAYVPALQHKGSKYSEDLPTILVEDPKGKASNDLQQSNNGAPYSLLIHAIQNEQENAKHRDSYETLNRKNSDMEDFLPSSIGRSRDEAIEIELSPRLTHFIDEGLVPESPFLNIDHHVTTVEKSHFLRHSLEDDKDLRCLTAIRVNRLSSDGLASESVIDALCESNSPVHFNTPNHAGISGMSSKGASVFKNEVKRAENTMFEVINDNNLACTINEAVHTSAGATNEVVHTPKTTKHSSSEDWKCNYGEASTSFFRAPKYKRLCKYGDVVGKLPAKTLHKTFKLVEKTCGGTVNIRDGEPKHSYGEKDTTVRQVDAFIEEEAEVSSDASVSEDEADDEKNDHYDDSFIDDRINPTNGSTEAENSEVDMIAFYRRSLLTQSPAKFPGNYLPTSHESLSSATAGSFSPDNKHNLMETPQNCLISFDRIDDKNSAICIADVATTESGAINHSEKCSNKLESRKRKLIFQPSNTILDSNSNLRHEMSSQQAERNLHHPSKFAQSDSHLAFDDDFYQDLDLDEVEAQATKLLRCRSELSSGKSQAERVHDYSAQVDEGICSPSFDLGI